MAPGEDNATANQPSRSAKPVAKGTAGSLLHVASVLFGHERKRPRKSGQSRSKGTIDPRGIASIASACASSSTF